MEQPNMIPNGMGGGNNMNMPNASMQRAQNGNAQQQLHAVIMEHLRGSLQQLPPGWQQTFDIRERASRIMQMVTMLRNLDNSMQKCLNIAENWEFKIITQCQSKEHYFAQWDQKFAEITRKRQMQASQNGLGMPQQNNMGNMHNMGMQQNGGMNGMGNGMGGMNMNNFNGMGINMPNAGMGMPNQMNMGQQGGFPQQLQRQMQPSPMPPQNQQQQPQNGSIDPSALTRNPQKQNHMPNQMSQPNQQQQQQQRQQQNMNPGQGGPPNGPSDNEVKQLARRMHDSTSEEQKNQIRAQFLNNMTEQQRQQARQQNMDPLARFFMQRARANLLKARQQGGQNGMGMAIGANMQQNPSQSGQQPNFDFSSIMGQQANAIKSQESGGEVVPASNNNNSSSSSNNNNIMQQGGSNQQQMMNFGQNGGGNPQMANNMQFAAMQEKQKREQMARQNHMAKQQALAQQNQLRGQPGGLNAPNALNGGQVNSPAMNMNMLNRPTFPPGQTTPSTPHQNQNQNMHGQPPQTPSTGANQLQQHHQNMLNQNQMGQENLHQQFLSGLNPESRAKLATLNPEQVNVLMQKFAAQRQSAMAPPGGQPNGQNMGMNMGGQPMHNQAMMGNAVPGFNSQPPPNQQGHMEPQAGLQQKLQQQQNAQLKQKAMDSRPFPKQVLQTLSLSVPEHVNSWGKLRQHIVQNQSVLPQELMGKLSAMQNQWFDTHPEELKQAVEQIKRMIHAQNVQRQGQQGPQGMPMPNGQAPQAQMVAPPAQMQQRPPSQAPDNIPQEHINKIREKWPQARNMTDDQIREQMRKTRGNQMQQQANADMQQQQNLKNAQMNANMQRAQQMMGNGAQQNQQSAPQRQSGQQQPQGQGQKRGNSDDVVEIPNPNAQATQQQQQPSQLQQGQQQNQRNMPPMPNVGGLKTREEIMAMPAEQREAYKRKMQEIQALRKAQIGIGANQPNAPQQVPQQAQQQPSTPQVQQQQQQQPQQNSVQNQPPANVQQELYKIRGIYAKVQSEFTKGPEVQLDPPYMQKAQELLRKLWPIAQTLDKTLLAGHRAFGEDRIKEAIKIKHIILQNAADANGTIKDYLAVSVETLMHFERFIGEYLKELKARQQAQNQPQAQGGQADGGKQAQANTQPAAQQPKPAQQPQGKQTPTTQQQKGQAQPPLDRKNSSQHARKASQNKAPPAPTDDTKKFDWSGTPTPHGVPKYDPGRTELTADKLKFPPPKKRKTTDSQSSTPAAQTGTPASPQVTSGPKRESPEQVRKMPPAPMPEPERPRFSCEEPFCFASAATQGFESEEALRKHMDEEHKTIEDPFKFLVETVDQGLTAMGVDKDGIKLPQQKSKAQTAARRPPAAQRVADRKAAAAATASTTPALKAESATPATPASAGKGRAGVAATPVGKKAGEAEAKEQAHEGDKTLYDSLVEQLGIEPSANQPMIAAPSTAGAAAGVVEEDPFLFSLSEALGPNPTTTNQFSAMDLDEPFDFDAWCSNDFRDLDLGVPREPLALTASDSDASPQLTPSSSIASQSTGEINISEAQRLKMVFEWDPSGNGDTAVPERLRQMALSDGSVEGGAVEGDKWDWSGDGASWDEIFGMDVDGDHGFAAAFGAT